MRQDQQFQKLVIMLRVAYWFVVAAIVAVIYATPDKQPATGSAEWHNTFYYLLLAVCVGDVIVAVYTDRLCYRTATSNEPTPARANIPKPRIMPVLLFAFGISTAIYGLVYRLIGGSMSRSLSFLIFTFICYIIFSLATIRYAALFPTDGPSLDS